MIRRFLPDIVSIAAIAVIVVFVAVWQNMQMDIQPRPVGQTPLPAKTSEAQPDQRSILNIVVADDALKKRNIFAETGSYVVTKKAIKSASGGEPYTLLGILSGKERKAVIRDEQGIVTYCSVGKKIGGFIVTRIDNTSVRLKSGTETRELKIFNVQYKPPKR
jgi:hypothetical protein